MSSSPAVKRYAAALFQACQEDKRQQVLSGLQEALRVLQEPDIWGFLIHPRTSPTQRRQLLEPFDLASPANAFVDLVIEKRRETLLPAIVQEFSLLIRAAENRVEAIITSPEPISETQQERLRKTLSGLTGKQVSLDSRINPEILGGLVIEIDGQVIDGSIAHELAKLRRRLSLA